jgi:hypothetical protein
LTSVHGEPGDAELGQGLAHFLELERLDDGGDLLHGRLRGVEEEGTPQSTFTGGTSSRGSPRATISQGFARRAILMRMPDDDLQAGDSLPAARHGR